MSLLESHDRYIRIKMICFIGLSYYFSVIDLCDYTGNKNLFKTPIFLFDIPVYH